MGTIFANAPIKPTVACIEVGKIYFDKRCDIRRCTASATTNIRPIDHIGRPMADLNVCDAHAEQLVQRARAKGLEVSMRS